MKDVIGFLREWGEGRNRETKAAFKTEIRFAREFFSLIKINTRTKAIFTSHFYQAELVIHSLVALKQLRPRSPNPQT